MDGKWTRDALVTSLKKYTTTFQYQLFSNTWNGLFIEDQNEVQQAFSLELVHT